MTQNKNILDTRDKNTLNSKVTAVTVYTDRAQVTRSATINLSKGEHTCLFDELPEATEANSIQVNGSGNALLRDVQFKQEFFTEIKDAEVKALYQQQQSISDAQRVIQDKMDQVENEKAFISNITAKLTAENEATTTSQLDPEKWVKMVEFYRNKMSSLDEETREAERETRELDKQEQKVNNEIYLKGNAGKERKQVEILIEVQEEGEFSLDLSYIVYGPGWRPYYDLRVNSESKVMSITYNANICQNTGEDWQDVCLKLSTAQANISGQQPQLSPWHVSEQILEPSGSLTSGLRRDKSGDVSRKSQIMNQMVVKKEASEADESEFGNSTVEIKKPVTTVETKATSVVFNISGRSNIDSDNIDHKATILIENFPASFRYSCVPKLTSYAYLKAQVVNNSDYPFLAGPTNIFLDNNFVANGEMDLIATTEKFWTFLGVDEAMKVEHKFLKRKVKQAGMFNKSNVYTYEYLIEITNNKKSQEEIVIWDQLPISNHEKITVKLLMPEYNEDSQIIKMNEYKYIEWFFKPSAGEKIKVPLKFSIEYPSGMAIEGL